MTFSVLLIVAILCEVLRAVNHINALFGKPIIAIMGIFGWFFVCDFVRCFRRCAVTVRKREPSQICAGFVRQKSGVSVVLKCWQQNGKWNQESVTLQPILMLGRVIWIRG